MNKKSEIPDIHLLLFLISFCSQYNWTSMYENWITTTLVLWCDLLEIFKGIWWKLIILQESFTWLYLLVYEIKKENHSILPNCPRFYGLSWNWNTVPGFCRLGCVPKPSTGALIPELSSYPVRKLWVEWSPADRLCKVPEERRRHRERLTAWHSLLQNKSPLSTNYSIRPY